MVSTTTIFAILSASLLILSFIFDRKKTILGLKKGLKMFVGILPSFLNILIIISVLFFLIPDSMIIKFVGPDSGALGFLIAALIGSITLIPGIISYPLAAALLAKGAAYSVVAVFMTTLMMVGVVTLPLEIQYFGKKAAILRNVLNFIAALIIGLCVGWVMSI